MIDMKNPNFARLRIDQPAQYRIRIKGKLEEHFSERMGGLQISRHVHDDTITTSLEGKLVDQAALFGVLVALYNLRLPLISVECVDTDREEENPLMKIRIEQNPDYLEFIVSGIGVSLQISEPLETILNSCKLAGTYKVLVDFRGLTGRNRDDSGEEYAKRVGQQYQDYLAEGGSPLRAAVVGREEMSENWSKNEEIVRGYGLNVLVTENYEEAVAWLGRQKL